MGQLYKDSYCVLNWGCTIGDLKLECSVSVSKIAGILFCVCVFPWESERKRESTWERGVLQGHYEWLKKVTLIFFSNFKILPCCHSVLSSHWSCTWLALRWNISKLSDPAFTTDFWPILCPAFSCPPNSAVTGGSYFRIFQGNWTKLKEWLKSNSLHVIEKTVFVLFYSKGRWLDHFAVLPGIWRWRAWREEP